MKNRSSRASVALRGTAWAILLLPLSPPLIANPPAPTPTLERVEVTGSSIKRVHTEGALPVQTITREDIERLGVNSAEQLLATISANGTGADNLASNVGIQLGATSRNNNGNASANLRGLGASSTLVLLNGRRIPAHGAKGVSVDLSWIPFGAIDRVEVLKDGASAVYGSDAIGGVINFITREDVRGLEASAFVDITEAGGGNIDRGQLLAGGGDYAVDGYNLMAAVSLDRQRPLDGDQRGFANGYQPERGLSPDTSGTPFATQVPAIGTAIAAPFRLPGSGNQAFDRANRLSFEGACDSIAGMSQYDFALWGSPGSRYACAFDYGGTAALMQPVERAHLLARGTFAIAPAHSLIAEVTASRVEATKQFEPYQITTSSAALAGARYPAGGPYYQDLSAFVPGFDAHLPIAYRWRCDSCGGRTIETTTDAWRALVGAEGVLLDNWDYRVGLSSARSEARSLLGPGYFYTDGLISALGSGLINLWLRPGETQNAAGLERLASASAEGERLFDGESTLIELDGAVSGELLQLPAGTVGIAAGFDLRRESYAFSDGSTSTLPIFQAPFDAEFPSVEREIAAVFAEVAVPITERLEANLAVRRDHYSDFGDTTNPKLALRFSATDWLLLRASVNSGFRAPSFFQLYTAQSDAPVPGNIADPILCPAGNIPGADLSVCAIRPDARRGGNPLLQPETSRQWTVGLVASPAPWINFSIDAWDIARDGLIVELTPQEVIANHTTFPDNLVRGSNGRLDGPGGYIRAGFVNADGDRTRGIDISLELNGEIGDGRWTAGIDGTWLDSHRDRIFASEPFVERVGEWNARDLFLRWKHLVRVGYEHGPWSSTLSHQFSAGYKDQVPVGSVPPGFDPEVDAWPVLNLSVTYAGFENLTLTGGIKNLLDTDPPFSAHNLDFAAGAGWDPRVADPRGRAYTLRASYRFW